MKRAAVIAAALVLAACSSGGGTRPTPPPDPIPDPVPSDFPLSLHWTPIAEAEDGSPIAVAKYRLDCATSPEVLADVNLTRGIEFEPAVTSATMRLPAGTWFCRILAIAADGTSSDPSNIAQTTLPR